eukprot:TRINITY_DN3736_c0_g1_i2.p1 TRINITY_DN3736_c0_g1~~TRINITY_DN3736_c0_g1_i2.p1  ORF type:complete len:174 (-),score=20.54 TRINITY_DN3736_c0_g1_i2:927-1370(-)
MADASRSSYPSLLLPNLSQISIPFLINSYPPIVCRKSQIRCSVSAKSNDGLKVAETTTKTIPWGCETDSLENASALQQWLSESGLPPQKMEIDKVDVGERGLVALKNIRKGEKLLFVPPPLVISPDSVIFFFYPFELLGSIMSLGLK